MKRRWCHPKRALFYHASILFRHIMRLSLRRRGGESSAAELLSHCPHLLWSTLWIKRNKDTYVSDPQGKLCIDENQGRNPLLNLNLHQMRYWYIEYMVNFLRMVAMDGLRTISYLLLVVATFAATYLVSHV